MKEEKSGFNLELTTQRLEAFSDGVFAIAITLLILEIHVPEITTLQHASLSQYLVNYWPKYLAYIFSFIIIGIYWANHHYLFKFYKKTDHIFNLLNVLFLMSIAFLPFPSAVLGQFILEPEHKSTAVSFYCLGIFIPSFFWLISWLYACHKKRLIEP